MLLNCDYRFIKDTNDEYLVTEYGEIYSFKKRKLRKMSLTVCSKSKYSKGYYKCTLSVNNKKRYCMVHKLVAEHFVDGYFEGAVVNHKDGNSFNNYYKNLEWVTQKDNLDDANLRNDQTYTKWFIKWKIIYPDGKESHILNGGLDIKKYIEENELGCSYLSLRRHKHSKGFELKMIE